MSPLTYHCRDRNWNVTRNLRWTSYGFYRRLFIRALSRLTLHTSY